MSDPPASGRPPVEISRRESGTARRVGSILVGVAAIAIAARVSFPVPGSGVPQTAQTLAVVLVGAILGSRLGPIAVVVYVVVGAAGIPVFADGASGPSRLYGPTAGYLAGFVVAAWLVGLAAERGILGRAGRGFAALLAAHAVILLLGGLWLARTTGWQTAIHDGIAPFVAGAIVKSALAAAGAVIATRRGWRWARAGGPGGPASIVDR
jgi:biotin transport system substrate-specific component